MDIVKLLKQQSAFHSRQGVSEKDIEQAERALDLRFFDDYRMYLTAFGTVSFDGHELTGICKAKRLDVVAVTLEEREFADVPADWYVLEQTNIDGIVIWQAGNGIVYQTAPNAKAKKLCGSLAEYIAGY